MRTVSGRGGVARSWTGAVLLMTLAAAPAYGIPSFARQTKLPCSACHTQFPELNAFGRVFKLNGFTLRMIEAIEANNPSGHQDLAINLMPLPAVMFQASETFTRKPMPGTTNGNVLLPDQLSVFLAGAITPKVGAFIQATYDPADGSIGLDNTSIRYATPITLGGKPGVFGLTLNNNPTMQDVWNGTPAWGFPYVGSAVAPTPTAATLLDGTLGQQVAGLTGYLFFNDAIYAEFGGYHWAPQGASQLPDTSEAGVVEGVAPYWRVALTRAFGSNYLEVGTYGLAARIQPTPYVYGGYTDRYTDVAFDAEFQRQIGNNNLTLAGTWIHEKRSLGASLSDSLVSVAAQHVNTFRARATYMFGQAYAITLSPFFTTGTTDPAVYAPDPLDGSRTGSPNSSGLIAQLDWNPWMNTRITLQYTAYGKFNGASSNYDGSGRNASANNTLYLQAWLMF
jgi:hypothetical protein